MTSKSTYSFKTFKSYVLWFRPIDFMKMGVVVFWSLRIAGFNPWTEHNIPRGTMLQEHIGEDRK